MTQNNSEGSFEDVIGDVYNLLVKADVDTPILNISIPKKFKETDPLRILESFNQKFPGPYDGTTINDNFQGGKYKEFYQLYHDIKIASSIKIKDLKMGSDEYNNVDFFYKFASELILRESGLLKASLLNLKKDEKYSELEQQIAQDFESISYSYTSSNGEVITDITEIDNPNASAFQNSHQYGLSVSNQPSKIKIPLFTSSIKKSELDTKLTIVPGELGLSKTIPLLKDSGSTGSTFESVNFQTSKISLPTSKPTTILEGFHVLNWLPVGTPEWLDYKSKTLQPPVDSKLVSDQDEDLRLISSTNENVKSFAPTFDSKGFGIPNDLKASVWLSRVGVHKIDELRKQYFQSVGIEVNPISSKNDEPKPVENTTSEDSIVNGTKYVTSEELTDYDQTQLIPIKNLLEWDQQEIDTLESLKKDKSSIESSKSLQKLITKELLKLNKLRQQRYANSTPNNILAPDNTEKILYNKITKLISLTINLYKVSPNNLPLEFSKKVPVLMSEYSGTLPGIVTSKAKQNRLPNLRGSFKKKR
ncbi:chromatin structure-remodeling complex protein Rsc58p [[Candida] jaroonii]|uniref:Chromatin structure-remodeling complex protein Rsc58p n=1 Tax=[Candida] jaroonii TaxID=467808 RepID=A0ACA9Y138_9ASCO|nr:chromatin structure-remodeling complex protein Rsc58p [[Candida] jaroonii]